MRIDHALELSSAYRGTAILLGDVIEADDEYTGTHSRDVVELVIAVADRLDLDPGRRQYAELAALLHDVGKVKIPPEIINKPGPLDSAERELMNTHTIVGQEMLEQVGGLLGDIGAIVRSCHERGRKELSRRNRGEAIPLAARIVCTCDAWSAMTTDRPYRKALPEEIALAEEPRLWHAVRRTSSGARRRARPISARRPLGWPRENRRRSLPSSDQLVGPSASLFRVAAGAGVRGRRRVRERGKTRESGTSSTDEQDRGHLQIKARNILDLSGSRCGICGRAAVRRSSTSTGRRSCARRGYP